MLPCYASCRDRVDKTIVNLPIMHTHICDGGHIYKMVFAGAGKLPITGHKDTRMLMRYTHLRAENLVKRLG